MRSINLWSAMTSIEASKESFADRITSDDLRELGETARWHGQELSLQPTEEGWLIKVFSCFSEDGVTGIEILIPKDHREPTKILKDRNGSWEYHH